MSSILLHHAIKLMSPVPYDRMSLFGIFNLPVQVLVNVEFVVVFLFHENIIPGHAHVLLRHAILCVLLLQREGKGSEGAVRVVTSYWMVKAVPTYVH